jgi:superfamily II DNA or RNA helicase
MAFQNLLDQFLALDSHRRGRAFEHLCKWYLLNDPVYRRMLKRVWLWNEWPRRWGADTGIDLVAETNDGDLWAIQAKAYDPERTIKKGDVDSLLSESAHQAFSYRLLITTTSNVSGNAHHAVEIQTKPVGLVLGVDLAKSQVRWPAALDDLQPIEPEPLFEARPHQQEAVEAVVDGLDARDRGQLIMACGTGKTFVGVLLAEALEAKRTLVLVPTLSLLSQTLRVWCAQHQEDFRFLPVCSDPTVVGEKDAIVSSLADLGFPATTDMEKIRSFLRGRGRRIVFCTYQSSPLLAEAFARGRVPAFDLAIADEAHRCVGRNIGPFAAILDGSGIKAKKRLFMTATPRFYTARVKRAAGDDLELASMDDEEKFGPVLHTLSFPEAIERDLLSDYEVYIVGVDDEEYRRYAERGRIVEVDGKQTDARTLAAQIAVAKVMKKRDLRRVLTFHSRIDGAKRFRASFPEVVEWMPDDEQPDGDIWADYVEGRMATGQRMALLDQLRHLDDGQRGLLANARCLSEGVDVPTLDGVAFVDPRRSQVDIVQAVGRAIRKAADKTVGTILLPVFIESSEDADEALDSSAFKPVWDVVKALRAHDANLADELDAIRLELTRGPQRAARLPSRFTLDLPIGITPNFAEAFRIRTVLNSTTKPPLTVDEVLSWADTHFARERQWPKMTSGQIFEAPDDSWRNVNNALVYGLRGLTGRSSLASLLALHRGVRNRMHLPDLSVEGILSWADAHHLETGEWPKAESGPIEEAPGETWTGVHLSLVHGRRGLPGGSTLARLLFEHRGVRFKRGLPQFTVQQILSWADAYHNRVGEWPRRNSGTIEEAPDETWAKVDVALKSGTRGLTGGSSLARLLAQHRRVRNVQDLPRFTVDEILAWADAHHRRTGEWPKAASGPIKEAPGETWNKVQLALYQGLRGLPGGSSLARLLAEHSDGRSSTFEVGLRGFSEFAFQNGNCRVPRGVDYGGFDLGSWLTRQRQRYRAGTISEAEAAALESVRGWTWDPYEADFQFGADMVSRFAQREGHAQVPQRHREDGFGLGAWVTHRRHDYRKGKLSQDRIDRLESIPGWTWDARKKGKG